MFWESTINSIVMHIKVACYYSGFPILAKIHICIVLSRKNFSPFENVYFRLSFSCCNEFIFSSILKRNPSSASTNIRAFSCHFARSARHQQNTNLRNTTWIQRESDWKRIRQAALHYVSRERTAGDRGGRVGDKTTWCSSKNDFIFVSLWFSVRYRGIFLDYCISITCPIDNKMLQLFAKEYRRDCRKLQCL